MSGKPEKHWVARHTQVTIPEAEVILQNALITKHGNWIVLFRIFQRT